MRKITWSQRQRCKWNICPGYLPSLACSTAHWAPKEAKGIATNPPRVHDPLISKDPAEKLSNAHWAFWSCQWLCHPIQNALQLKSKRLHQQTLQSGITAQCGDHPNQAFQVSVVTCVATANAVAGTAVLRTRVAPLGISPQASLYHCASNQRLY